MTAKNTQFQPSRHLAPGRLATYGVLALFAVLYITPLWVMIVNSVKPIEEIYAGSFMGLPETVTLDAWRAAWSSACIGTSCVGLKPFFVNSLLIVVLAAAISTMIGALNGYIISKFKFRGAGLVFGLLVGGCFLPHQAIIIPLAQTLGMIGISNGIARLVIVHTIYGICFTTLFFRNYFVTVPDELVKAALIDGAGLFYTFWKIMLPISLPIVMVSVIWQFTNVWNDYIFSVALTSGQGQTVIVALNNIAGATMGRKEYNVEMAGALIAGLPTLLVYLFAGRFFVRGLTAGAVKG